MLRCLGKVEADYALLGVHKGIVKKHMGARALAKKIPRVRIDSGLRLSGICEKMRVMKKKHGD